MFRQAPVVLFWSCCVKTTTESLRLFFCCRFQGTEDGFLGLCARWGTAFSSYSSLWAPWGQGLYHVHSRVPRIQTEMALREGSSGGIVRLSIASAPLFETPGTHIKLWCSFSFLLLYSLLPSSVFPHFVFPVTSKPMNEIHVILLFGIVKKFSVPWWLISSNCSGMFGENGYC